MNNIENKFETASDWLNNNRDELAKYSGEWIAFTNKGVIANDVNGRVLAKKARAITKDFVFKFVHPLDIPRTIRILPIRIRSLKNNKWVPEYQVVLSTSNNSNSYSMLVDSGADISIIPHFIGEDLGLKLAEAEYIDKAQGVNGNIDFVVRNLNMTIDGHNFQVPIGWVLTEGVEDILLGREIVFDLFDIEFIQAERSIIFKKRTLEL